MLNPIVNRNAERAREMLVRGDVGYSTADIETPVLDALVNLRQLCDYENIDFFAVLERSESHYLAEKEYDDCAMDTAAQIVQDHLRTRLSSFERLDNADFYVWAAPLVDGAGAWALLSFDGSTWTCIEAPSKEAVLGDDDSLWTVHEGERMLPQDLFVRVVESRVS